MQKQNKIKLQSLEELLKKIENDIKRARTMIHNMTLENQEEIERQKKVLSINEGQYNHQGIQQNAHIIEGVFDGYFMIGSDKKKYPVPMNYASKSKLIPGDVLKLRIMDDGKLIYKLIGQASRQYIKATLSKDEEGKFTALTDEGLIYYLNHAAVSYHQGKVGDEITIIINADGIGNFAALEAVIHNNCTKYE